MNYHSVYFLYQDRPQVYRSGLWLGSMPLDDDPHWHAVFFQRKTTGPVVGYTLWLFDIAMENGPFLGDLWLFTFKKMVIFHSYVK